MLSLALSLSLSAQPTKGRDGSLALCSDSSIWRKSVIRTYHCRVPASCSGGMNIWVWSARLVECTVLQVYLFSYKVLNIVPPARSGALVKTELGPALHVDMEGKRNRLHAQWPLWREVGSLLTSFP